MVDEEEIIKKMKEDPNCIKLVAGGIGRDGDCGAFWDYVETLILAREILLGKNLKPPFTIISSKKVRMNCNTSNHIHPIAKEVFEENGEYYVLTDNVYVNEFDYIISRDWVDDWKIEELNKNFEYIKLKKGEKYVSTGFYGSLTMWM